jgi:hypothetical protein
MPIAGATMKAKTSTAVAFSPTEIARTSPTQKA